MPPNGPEEQCPHCSPHCVSDVWKLALLAVRSILFEGQVEKMSVSWSWRILRPQISAQELSCWCQLMASAPCCSFGKRWGHAPVGQHSEGRHENRRGWPWCRQLQLPQKISCSETSAQFLHCLEPDRMCLRSELCCPLFFSRFAVNGLDIHLDLEVGFWWSSASPAALQGQMRVHLWQKRKNIKQLWQGDRSLLSQTKSSPSRRHWLEECRGAAPSRCRIPVQGTRKLVMFSSRCHWGEVSFMFLSYLMVSELKINLLTAQLHLGLQFLCNHLRCWKWCNSHFIYAYDMVHAAAGEHGLFSLEPLRFPTPSVIGHYYSVLWTLFACAKNKK